MDEGLATIKVNTAERVAEIRRQLEQVDLSGKDKDTAFLIELIGGIVGLLGVGYIYSGLTNAGLVRLVGYWVFLFVLWTLFGVCTFATLGIAGCFFFVPLIVQAVVAFFSANELKQAMASAKEGMAARTAGGAASFGGYLNQAPETPAPPVVPPAAPVERIPPERPIEPPLADRDRDDEPSL